MMGYKRVVKDGKVFMVMPNGGMLIDSKAMNIKCDIDFDIPKAPGVYYLRCLISNKIYVGSTSNLYIRINGHYSKIKAGKAIRGLYSYFTYGKVEFKVIESGNLSSEALCALEQYYIIKFDSVYPRGFNKKDPFTQLYLPEVFDYLYNKKKKL